MALYQQYIEPGRTAEIEVLLGLVRAELTPDRIERISALVESGAVDWTFILHLAEKHRVWPVLYTNIKKAELQSFLSEDVQKVLSHQYLTIVGNNLRLCQKLTKILALFESRGIPAVPFKGPLLAQTLYEDEAMRCYADLDILVPEKRATQARDALLDAGFSPHVQGLSGKRFGQVLKHGRECHFLHPSGTVAIDLHWQLGVPVRRPFDYDFCSERLQVIPWQDMNISSLSVEDTLLHLCVNGAHDQWCDLENVLSVAEIIEQYQRIDWCLVQTLAERLHCKRMLFLGLFLARDVFDAALPPDIVDKIDIDRAVEKLVRKNYRHLFREASSENNIGTRVGRLPYYLAVREHAVDKLVYLLRRIFIPTQKDWENRYLNPRWAGFYFLTRPIDLAVELIRTLRPCRANRK